MLADLTRTGMLVDREGIEAFGIRLREKIDGALAAIQRQVDDPAFNPNSPKQLGELLFDKMHLPHGRKTSRGLVHRQRHPAEAAAPTALSSTTSWNTAPTRNCTPPMWRAC